MTIHAVCETAAFEAAQPCAVAIVLRVARELTEGDVVSAVFPNSWSVRTGPSFTREFQTADPDLAHHVSVSVDPPAAARFETRIAPIPLASAKGMARHPRSIEARLVRGQVPAGEPIRLTYANTFAPYIADREEVQVRVNGVAPVDAPVLTTRGGPHARFRVIAPSSARPETPFEALIVSLDRFDNVSSHAFDGERLLWEDGSVAAEGVRFQGSVRVSCRSESAGIRRLRFRDLESNAIRIGASASGPYWGDLHIHTRLSHDAQGGEPYAYARDAGGLDFAAACDHWESLGEDGYRTLAAWASAAHDPGRFVTIVADERNPAELTGHHNLYFAGDEVPERFRALRRENDPEAPNRFERLADASPDEWMLVPHHTGIGWCEVYRGGLGSAVRWDAADDRGLRPLVEIYSHHGQSELYDPGHVLSYELNRMRNPERRSNTSVPGPYYAQEYWMAGRRVGVIASSDEHSGQGGRCHGGLAAVFAPELTRADLFDALRRRRCYATTGERILMAFEVAGLPMGAEGTRAPGDPIAIRLKVWGTETLLRVDVLRHRFGVDRGFLPVYSAAPRPENRDAEVSIEDTFEGPCLYYARVMQAPLEWPGMAWTSPVWLDAEGAS